MALGRKFQERIQSWRGFDEENCSRYPADFELLPRTSH